MIMFCSKKRLLRKEKFQWKSLFKFAGNSPNFNLCGGCSGGCGGSCRFSKSWTLALDWPKPISKGAVISRVKVDSRLKEKLTMMFKRIFYNFSANKETEF